MPDEADPTTEETKRGARHNAGDQSAVQAVHDHAVSLGAVCAPADGKSLDDTLITFGTEVKALGSGRVGGYLVRFSDSSSPDLTGDYFDAKTDFGTAEKSATYYHHGLDAKIGRRVLGEAKLKKDDIGIWVESQLALRDEYEKAVYAMAEKGKLGWSSGTASHLVERQPAGKANHITRWPLGLDASLTPTPAEPRNSAQTLKSYFSGLPGQAALPAGLDSPTAGGAPAAKSTTTFDASSVKEPTMPDTAAPAVDAKAITDLSAAVVALTTKMTEVEAKLNAPVLPATGAVTDVKDRAAERPFKSLGEQLQAIRNAATNPSNIDRRLLSLNDAYAKAVKATGASEQTGADGGFLVQQEFSNETLNRAWGTGEILKRVRRRTIGPGANGIVINTLNETSRATGSRSGGLQMYWLNEGGTKTASRPAFRRFALNLEKLAGLFYATDELLADATGLEGEVTDAFSAEIKFMVEDAIVNGDGVGKPLGILAAASTVSIAKDAGQSAATISYANVVGMYARLWPGSTGNAVFLANKATWPALMSMYLPAGLNALPAPGMTFVDGVFRIFGVPVIFVEYMAALGTVGDLVLVDLNEYRFIEKGGEQFDKSIHVAFVTDETAFRWVYRCNGAPFWNAAVTPYKGSSTLSPYISLATRA